MQSKLWQSMPSTQQTYKIPLKEVITQNILNKAKLQKMCVICPEDTLSNLCKRLCVSMRSYMCDGLFYNTGQIFKLNVTTASGLNKPGPTLQLVVQGKMGTQLSLDGGQRVSMLVQRTLCDTNSQQHRFNTMYFQRCHSEIDITMY